MPVDANALFQRGGKDLIDFLQFAIVSGRPAPVCAFLIVEYRIRPTALAAIALFEQFAQPTSPALVHAAEPKLTSAINAVRVTVDRHRTFVPSEEQPSPPVVPSPPGYLFDSYAVEIAPRVAMVATAFDPLLGPIGSLPGGKMTPGQRSFAEQTWCKRARPALVAAGFWRVATLGQP